MGAKDKFNTVAERRRWRFRAIIIVAHNLEIGESFSETCYKRSGGLKSTPWTFADAACAPPTSRLLTHVSSSHC